MPSLRNQSGKVLWAISLALIVLSVGIAEAQVTEFPIPTVGSLPTGITPGPDGNLWFAEHGTNVIGRITPDGIITDFQIPNSGVTTMPAGIALGHASRVMPAILGIPWCKCAQAERG